MKAVFSNANMLRFLLLCQHFWNKTRRHLIAILTSSPYTVAYSNAVSDISQRLLMVFVNFSDNLLDNRSHTCCHWLSFTSIVEDRLTFPQNCSVHSNSCKQLSIDASYTGNNIVLISVFVLPAHIKNLITTRCSIFRPNSIFVKIGAGHKCYFIIVCEMYIYMYRMR